MIVDADVVLARPGGLVGRAGYHERRGLAAADVAAFALRRPERREQPVDERDGRRLPCLEHRRPDRRPLHHVRLDRDAVGRHVARRGDARSAGPRGGSAVGVDDADLADRPTRIGLEQRGQGVGRTTSAPEQRQPVRAVSDLRERLRRHRSDAGLDPRAGRARRTARPSGWRPRSGRSPDRERRSSRSWALPPSGPGRSRDPPARAVPTCRLQRQVAALRPSAEAVVRHRS